MSRLQFLAALVAVGFMGLVSWAAEGAAPATKPAGDTVTYEQAIHIWVRELASKDALEVKAAEIKLALVPMDGLPMMEEAGKKPGVPAEAIARLNKIIAREKELLPARQHLRDEYRAAREEDLRTALEAYDKAGTKDPKWDADARDAIKLFINPADKVERSKAKSEVEKAVDEGCSDPFILFICARRMVASTPEKADVITQLYDRATAGFEKSQYPASRKVRCYMHNFSMKLSVEHRKNPGPMIEGEAGKALHHLVDITAATLPAIAAEKLRESALIDFSGDMLTTFSRERKQMFDALYPPLEKMAPDDSAVLTVKGRFYIDYAWDARGTGLANTVTDDGWKKMRERLDIAADALTKAWEKDNFNHIAAASMVNVELGQGQGRNRMELWFNRALKADPDAKATCLVKLNYLEPKWFGTPQDMVTFGHQCLEGGNWSASIPLVLVDAHKRLARYAQSPQQYLSQPQVWNDIDAVYQPYLKAEPNAYNARSNYCDLACHAGKWALAKQQFDLLGDNAVPASFGGMENMQRMHDLANSQGTSPATP